MAEGPKAGDYRIRLPRGVILDGVYRIDEEIGAGGFGITYRGRDLKLGHSVAIKEYFPNQVGNRDSSMSVHPITTGQDEVFVWGRDGFIREAQMLAAFRHTNIVRVVRYFEANNTAYMVLEYEEGPSFAKWLATLGRDPTQEELDKITLGLMAALEEIHKKRLVHRDIAPDNIIIRSDLTPVVLDFGAARYEVHDTKVGHTASFAVIKAYYSPLEQRSTEPKNRGAWSDIYSLGATLYRAVAGSVPPDVQDRGLQDDPMQPTALLAAGKGYRPSFLSGIDAAMHIKRVDRPQSIAALRTAMGFDGDRVEPPVPPVPPSPTTGPGFLARYARPLVAVAAALGMLVTGGWLLSKPDPSTEPRATRVAPVPPLPPVKPAQPHPDRSEWNKSRASAKGLLETASYEMAGIDRTLETRTGDSTTDARNLDLATDRIERASQRLNAIWIAIDTLSRTATLDAEKNASAALSRELFDLRQRLDRQRGRVRVEQTALAKRNEDEARRRADLAAEQARKKKAEEEAAARARDQIETADNVAVDGADISILRNTARSVCLDTCQRNTQCRSFAYDKWNQWCFLKSEAKSVRLDPKYESGIRKGERPTRATDHPTFDVYRRRAFPSGTETTQRTDTPEQCQSACDGSQACIAFTFVQSSRTCRLMRATPVAYEPDDGATSGVKRQQPPDGDSNAAAPQGNSSFFDTPADPAAKTYTVWLHNDSEMRLFADGLNRRFV